MQQVLRPHIFFRRARRLVVPLGIGLFLSHSSPAATYTSVNAYVKHYAPLVKQLSEESGIPASVIMGVAVMESGYGNSLNAKLLNNHFGIVGRNKMARMGVNYRSSMRQFDTDVAAFRFFCRMIKRKFYYHSLKGNPDYKLWLLKMNNGYYSSAGLLWVKKITAVIEKHKLHRLDLSQHANKKTRRWPIRRYDYGVAVIWS